MKLNNFLRLETLEVETLATFGAARLTRHLDGRYELLGGTPADRAAAEEWCAQFLPEALVAHRGARWR